MVELFTEEERARIEAAVAAAEARTSGEIVVMAVRSATDYKATEITAAAIAALVLPGVLLPFEAVPALVIWISQLVLFTVLGVLLPLLAVGKRIVGTARRERDVRAAAEAQFFAQGLRNTQDRAAVLVFVAIEEHIVEVLYDDAAGKKVGKGEWRSLAGDLARRMKAGEAVAGLEDAARRAGDLLAPHFPPRKGDRNELPDVILD